ncbi:MAG TPA: TonB family protein [Chthoniobacterales bacterium]|nr:TonB family protein [Chthoniobacterales bacterium]
MKNSFLALLSGLILVTILAMSWCGRKPPPDVVASPTPSPTPVALVTPSPTPTLTPTPSPEKIEPSVTPAPAQTPSAELKKAGAKSGPAIILITTFDASGKLLRTGTAFFAANDGRLITDWHLVQDAAYAVAKSPDGKIRNVTGVVASSPALDLAVLKAETKVGVPFVRFGKNTESNTQAAIVGSSLGRHEQPVAAVQVTGHEVLAGGDSLLTSAPVSADADGSPVLDENGEVIGIVAQTSETNQPSRAIVRPADALVSLFQQTHPDSPARWAAAPNESPSPSTSPKGKVVYNPSPVYPDRARSFNPPLSGSGRFRIVFDASGAAKTVEVVHSTGQPMLDRAAIEAFQKWKSIPGQEWTLMIPITFQPQ